MFFNSAGEAVRRPQDTTLWERTATAATGDPELPRRREDEEADPGLLYAGQWRDAESGLCYNRFRYYEPESGMYLVSDPIGLQGGEQTYRYVANPCGWVDPLGLTKSSIIAKLSTKKIPQGLTKEEFDIFSQKLKDVLTKEGIPTDNVFVHGSRANGTAVSGVSDIDVKVILNDKDFGAFAAKRIAESSGRTKKLIMDAVRKNQKINARGISRSFESTVWDEVFTTLPPGEFTKVQISVMTKTSPFNTNPSIMIP